MIEMIKRIWPIIVAVGVVVSIMANTLKIRESDYMSAQPNIYVNLFDFFSQFIIIAGSSYLLFVFIRLMQKQEEVITKYKEMTSKYEDFLATEPAYKEQKKYNNQLAQVIKQDTQVVHRIDRLMREVILKDKDDGWLFQRFYETGFTSQDLFDMHWDEDFVNRYRQHYHFMESKKDKRQ